MNEDLSELDLIGLLDRLEPVSEPSVVSLWPQTEAWLWVGLVALGLAVWLIRSVVLRRRVNAYRRIARREIAAAESAAALAEILKRTALAAFPRVEVAGLYGEEWLVFLDRTGGGSDFCEGIGRAIAQAPYAPRTENTKELAALATRWVRGHRIDAEVAS